MSETTTPGYEVGKVAERQWAVFFRLDERTSFDQRVRYATKREAVSVASALNREQAELNRTKEAS
jgi:hypothetical protein